MYFNRTELLGSRVNTHIRLTLILVLKLCCTCIFVYSCIHANFVISPALLNLRLNKLNSTKLNDMLKNKLLHMTTFLP
jgi:hypothetical protein